MRVLIIQARLGSTRLPGKVLKEIQNVPMIDLILSRLYQSNLIDQSIVATTNSPTDDKLVKHLQENQVQYFRGSENDVLDRYYQAAVTLSPQPNDTIIRICADNPLHHHKVFDFAIQEFESKNLDYFSNSNYEPDYLEDGFDVEVFKFWLLEKAWKEATLKSEREHVCPFMKKPDLFKCGWKKYNPNYNYKLSVDTQDDFEAISTIFEKLYPSNQNFGYEEVLSLLEKEPEILEINKNSVINSGYHKSLKED